MIESLFPEPVVSIVASNEMWDAPLHPDESKQMSKAASKRRREFAAGRACARAALERMGIADAVLLRNPDRTPAWPASVVGSISHCDRYCAAAVARRSDVVSLGLDVESRGRVDRELLPRICNERERRDVEALASQADVDWASIFFSAKEAAYKCYFPITGKFLGFHDVELRVEPGSHRFEAILVREDAPSAHGVRNFHGRFSADDDRVYTAVTLMPGEVQGGSGE
jgi:4'-phosphopantetheinyl transferase EntD